MTPFLTITQASATYPVYVGRDLLSRVGELLRPRGKVFVITSSALHRRFGIRFGNIVAGSELLLIREGEAESVRFHPTQRTACGFGVGSDQHGMSEIRAQNSCG